MLLNRFDLRLVPASIFLFVLPYTHTVALRLISLLLAAIVAIQLSWRKPHAPLPCRLPLCLWIGICALSLSWSIAPTYSIGEFKNEVGYVMVAFLTFFYTTRNEAAWHLWRGIIVTSCVAISLLAIVYIVPSGNWPMRSPFFQDRNMYSTYAVLVIPLFLLILLQIGIKTFFGIFTAFAVLLALACGYLTINRTFWPALVGEIVVFFCLASNRSFTNIKSRIIGVLLLIVVCSIFVAGFITVDYVKIGPSVTDSNAIEKSMEQSLRPQIWLYAAKRIAQRPMTGYGFGLGILRKDFESRIGVQSAWHAHNVILNSALETGIPGMILLLFLFAALVREFWRLYVTPRPEIWMIGTFGLTLLVGAALKSMTDNSIIREDALLFWSLIGMSLGYAGHKLAGITESLPSPSIRKSRQ
ncbi:MAG: O-antigen ligase family protein [Ktedonobacteraceae bacterium]